MIKLINILKELSLNVGHAKKTGADYMALEGMVILLSVKGMAKYDFEKDPEANKLAKPLIDDLLTNTNVVGESGQYKLLVKKGRKSMFYMIDTNAETVDRVFVGTMKVEDSYESYNFNPKKAFDLKVWQVHWSNIASEFMGKGLGKILYTMVYEYVSSLGAALASDSVLFDGSSGLWRKYMANIASYFGIIINDIILPVTKEDVTDTSLVSQANLDGFIAMEKPPALIRKITYNVKGLSFAKGEYGTTSIDKSINDQLDLTVGDNEETDFLDLVDNTDTIKELVESLKYELNDIHTALGTDNISNCKCLIFAFTDAIVIVKQVGERLVAQLL
jgi:hypothetical protein